MVRMRPSQGRDAGSTPARGTEAAWRNLVYARVSKTRGHYDHVGSTPTVATSEQAMKIFFSVVDRIDLWPHFRRHYEAQGVTEFFCLTYGPNGDRNILDNDVTHWEINIPKVDYVGKKDTINQNCFIGMHVHPKEWFVIADLDEFHVVPDMTLLQAARHAEAEGCHYIQGRFYDRVTANGHLPAELENDIWKQFPLSTNATVVVSHGEINKVSVARGDVRFSAGHHYVHGRRRNDKKIPWEVNSKTYHFKWWGGQGGGKSVAQFFNDRYVDLPPYLREKANLTEHFHEHDGIDVSALKIFEREDGC